MIKTAKFWVWGSLSAVLLIIILVGVCNYIFDPFQQYRTPTFYKPLYLQNYSRYITPGLIKTRNFETAILGTSTSQNIKASDVNKIFNTSSIKLTLSGGSGAEFSLLLSTILNRQKLKRVIWGIDLFTFRGKPNRLRFLEKTGDFPFYLFDNNILNDWEYILNLSTLFYSIKTIKENILKPNSPFLNYDKIWSWAHQLDDKSYSKTKLRKNYQFFKNNGDSKSVKDIENLKKSVSTNLFQFASNHPETEFIIILQPYSIYWWKIQEDIKKIETLFKFREFIAQESWKLNNIELFDFQADPEYLLSTEIFKDIGHFKEQINLELLNKTFNKSLLANINKVKENNNFIRNEVRKLQTN